MILTMLQKNRGISSTIYKSYLCVFFPFWFFPPRIWGVGYVLSKDAPVTLTWSVSWGFRKPQHVFPKPLHSQFKLAISPSPGAVWEAHRFCPYLAAPDFHAEIKLSWKITPKPRNGVYHFEYFNSWTVETCYNAVCYRGFVVWKSCSHQLAGLTL